MPEPTRIVIDGIPHTIEKLPSGCIRVSHPEPPFNPMHGVDTGGLCIFEVHPYQRHQYEFWNSQLPPQERAMPERMNNQRPWWSLGPGERATSRE